MPKVLVLLFLSLSPVVANAAAYFCTIYYTPRETGFSAQRGFNMALETRPGLKQHRFPHDFLEAVKKEGFGLIKTPVDGLNFIYYAGGTWGFARNPVGSGDRPLIPRQSCAVSIHSRWSLGSKLRVNNPAVENAMKTNQWLIVDAGGGLKPNQIDLYWGEDDPEAPGPAMARPKGTNFKRVPVENVALVR